MDQNNKVKPNPVKQLYQDPENKGEIFIELKNAETHDNVIKIINKTFPKWIIGWPKKYCIDYPSFQNNWEYVCKKTNTRPLSIIIVDEVDFKSSNHELIRAFAELLTLFGHSVRRKTDFVACKMCGNAIPNEKLFNELVSRKIKTPKYWMLRCSTC